MPNAFPSTMQEWIVARLEAGADGRADVASHIMDVYSGALQVYWLGSSFRTPDEEAADVIAGFFADRLSRENWIRAWPSSGLRLRRWLMNGLLMYLHEQIRSANRTARVPNPTYVPNNCESDAVVAYERAWAKQLVANACLEASRRCDAAGLREHWDVFHRHYLLGDCYGDIVRSTKVTARQAEVRCRAARSRFVSALRESLRQDGAHEDELDDEIRSLMEVLG